jgi:hypothetical protein
MEVNPDVIDIFVEALAGGTDGAVGAVVKEKLIEIGTADVLSEASAEAEKEIAGHLIGPQHGISELFACLRYGWHRTFLDKRRSFGCS